MTSGRPSRSRSLADARRGQRGLTLVELMIAMVLTSVVILMTFAISVQVSTAYRFQARVAELQQSLTAAEAVLVRDLRQAGYLLPDGFTLASDDLVHLPVEVENRPDDPDTITVAYADPTAQARVLSLSADRRKAGVDDTTGFAEGDLVVLSDTRTITSTTPVVAQPYDACVVQVEQVTPTVLVFTEAAPWGRVGNPHCARVAAAVALVPSDTMVYRFAYRTYRIDPDRRDLAVLQRSQSGGVEDDWEDLGIGFTDLQVATRWSEPGDLADTTDPDTDPARDWYSSEEQETLTAPRAAEVQARPLEIALSIVVRTTQPVGGLVTSETPMLTDEDNLKHNALGDRPSVLLDGIADALRAEEHRGNHVYRWSTFRTDLRNLGVGM